ncbi:MAG TPA: metalloregulator ArsR/SmtB family transcription factor [Thermodesulfobacteriota bacterium]|nr:metalloregulator ArsR/SmtB family transcription factor [Thermodesulfobacteriota bacterium]
MEQLIQLFRALSEEARLRIVMLLTNGELCVCDLMAILEEPQSKISRHLAYLTHSGLTKGKRVGVWMHYSLKEPLDEVYKAEIEFLKKQLSHLPQLCSDSEKLLELKREGCCKAVLKLKNACWSGERKARKKSAAI